MKFYKIIFLFFVISFGQSQEISGIVIDSLNQEPIPFATIISNFNKSTITNEEGRFRIFKETSFNNEDTLFISSLGYSSISFSVTKNVNFEIILAPKGIELKSIVLTNREKLTANEIISRVKKNAINIYDFKYVEKKIFWRETNTAEVIKLDFKIKKTSIKEFDQTFMDSIMTTIPKATNFYIETLALFYGNRDLKKQKVNIIKSAELLNKDNQISIELIEKKIQPIVDLRIKPDSYFKFKSGIFPIDLIVNGVDLRSIDSTDNDQLEINKKKKLDEIKDYNIYNRNFIKNKSNFYFDTEENELTYPVFRKSRLYDFKLVEFTYLGFDPVYVIDYEPASKKEQYRGRLYVHADEFALIRIDYENTEPLRKFNLFGVSFKFDTRHGKQIFKKNHNGKYDLYFYENTNQNTFGLDRLLKIIEKNKNVRGRRKQNQLNMQIDFKGKSRKRTEFIILNESELNIDEFNIYKEIDSILPYKLNEYNPDFWKGYNIIEPSQILKEFKIDEND